MMSMLPSRRGTGGGMDSGAASTSARSTAPGPRGLGVTGGSCRTDRARGVVPVLGLTLLIGIVAVASIGLFVVGADTLTSSSDDLEDEQVQQAFIQLGSDLDTVAASRDDTRSIALGLEDAPGDVDLVDAGHLTVTVGSEEEPLVDQPLQAIEYRDGEQVMAYQAGGVFEGDADHMRVVSSPSTEYRDRSLHIPVTRLGSADSASNNELHLEKTSSEILTRNDPTIDGQFVTITLESPYYQAWGTHFEDAAGPDAVVVDDSNQTVTLTLGQPDPGGTYEETVTAQGDVHLSGASSISGPIAASGEITADDCETDPECMPDQDIDLRSIDDDIEYLFETTEDADPIEGDTIDAGTYAVDDLVRDDTLTVDVSDGNVTILADGHVALRGATIDVVGGEDTDNVARLYTTGDVAIGNGDGGVAVSDDRAERFQLYGTSEMQFAIGQGDFRGTVYAPRDEPANRTNEAIDEFDLPNADCSPHNDSADVCIGTGSGDFNGSIVSGPISTGQSVSVSHDETLTGVEPTIAVDPEHLPPALDYLTVIAHDVAVESD